MGCPTTTFATPPADPDTKSTRASLTITMTTVEPLKTAAKMLMVLKELYEPRCSVRQFVMGLTESLSLRKPGTAPPTPSAVSTIATIAAITTNRFLQSLQSPQGPPPRVSLQPDFCHGDHLFIATIRRTTIASITTTSSLLR